MVLEKKNAKGKKTTCERGGGARQKSCHEVLILRRNLSFALDNNQSEERLEQASCVESRNKRKNKKKKSSQLTLVGQVTLC